MRDWVDVPFREQHAEPKAIPQAPPGQPHVFVGLPSYDGWHKSQALVGLMLPSMRARLHYELGFGSLLARTFNDLLCKGRNSRAQCPWTHWALHHADISVGEMWLDVLIAEMARTGADILSAVVAIKDDRGLTSTGTIQGDGSIRRLTRKECARLPETFSAADLPALGIHTELVVNTGLLLIDFTKPWSDEFHFNVGDGIRKNADGTFGALVLPEDWNFSHWANGRGLKVFATRKLHVQHWDGGQPYGSEPGAGDWETDLGDDPSRYEEVRAARAKEGVAA